MDGLHNLVDFVAPAERVLHALGRVGDRAAPVQVLLEPEGGEGHPAAGGTSGSYVAGVAALSASDGGADDNDATGGRLIVGALMAGSPTSYRAGPDEAAAGHLVLSPTLTAGMGSNVGHPGDAGKDEMVLAVASALTAREGKGPDSDATTTLIPHVAYGLRADPGGVGNGHNTNYVAHALTANPGNGGRRREDDSNLVAHALTAEGADASEDGTGRGTPLVPTIDATAVRRLTPLECERLQGFPDGWTATSWGKPQSDSARYREIGNSVAVPVFEWVARRLVAAYLTEVTP